MSRVKVSDKYQIKIPKDIRKALHIRKGQLLSVRAIGGVIEMAPDEDIEDMEGIFPELTLTGIREESDRNIEE